MAKKSRTKQTGVCKLTGVEGVFIQSHLIPQAFTRPEVSGEPLTQAGVGKPIKKRWTSWYDPALVTAEGEAILADLDSWAAKTLRKKKLVWSGWGPDMSLADNEPLPGGFGWGIRRLTVEEPDRLRLFLLSLLWRAAASSLTEFSEVSLPAVDLETLRLALVEQKLPPVDFYPGTLTQLSTMGKIHNLSPIVMVKENPGFDLVPPRKIDIFRFYFDGLIIHFHRHAEDDGYTEELGSLIAGQEQELIVSTVTFEESFQKKNLQSIMMDQLSRTLAGR